jgi:hypothetical protein
MAALAIGVFGATGNVYHPKASKVAQFGADFAFQSAPIGTPSISAPSANDGFVSKSVQVSISKPTRVTIPELGIDVPLIPETTSQGALGIPSNLNQWAWYNSSSEVFSSSGAILLAGHVDSAIYGTGPAQKLWSLKAGTVAYLYDQNNQREAFVAKSLIVVDKADLVAKESNLISEAGSSRLVIVTCGGTFNISTGHWSSNVLTVFQPIN